MSFGSSSIGRTTSTTSRIFLSESEIVWNPSKSYTGFGTALGTASITFIRFCSSSRGSYYNRPLKVVEKDTVKNVFIFGLVGETEDIQLDIQENQKDDKTSDEKNREDTKIVDYPCNTKIRTVNLGNLF